MNYRFPSTCLCSILLFASAHSALAQEEPYRFAPMDEGFERIRRFHDVDTITVVYPHGYVLSEDEKALIEGYVFWEQGQNRPAYFYLDEHDLNAADSENHLQYYGPFDRFTNQHMIDIPIQPVSNGFQVEGNVFDQRGDAFFYITDDGTRLFTCRNSAEAPFPATELPLGAYQLNVLRDNELIYTGIYSEEGSTKDINDLTMMRREYFAETLESAYFDIYLARDLLDNDTAPKAFVQKADAFVDALCNYLTIAPYKLPRTKLYFYNSNEELQLFLAQPLWQTIHGKALEGNNHITGLSLSTMKHEIGHTVIDFGLGRNPHAFWYEGFRQYTDYFFSEGDYQLDRRITLEHIDLLTPELIFGATNYFNNEQHYPISGVFVRYLIDQVGYEAFVEAYIRDDMDTLVDSVFTSTDNLILDFRKALKLDQQQALP